MVPLIPFKKKHFTKLLGFKTNLLQSFSVIIDAFKEGENNTALNKVHTAHGGAPHGM